MKRRAVMAALACALLSLNATNSHADIVDGTLAVSPSASVGYGSPASYIYGYEFSVAGPIEVTALAYYQDPVEDEDDSHLVRLWDATAKTVLASASVGPGSDVVTTGPHAFWATVLAAPVQLPPGTYAVSGSASPIDWFLQTLSPVPAPGITFVGAIYENPGVDTYPSGRAGGVYFGANLLFAPVPEPGPGWLMLAGLGVLLVVTSTRRRRG